uniref:ATP-dependent RNA helicase n=1 Tax=Rhabditophanes sp. KR3021 TaxID=114890 RepID=A0AC35TQH9_9BILA
MGDFSEDEAEINYEKFNTDANRKNKKSGGWQMMGLDYAVHKAIDKKGFKQPTPIQRKAIPPILDGRDVVAMSRTGSGKTAAFVIPMLQKLKMRNPTGTRAVLISPTRELALQTFHVVKELGRFTGLQAAYIVGGESLNENFSSLHQTPDILVATPGRLAHVAVEMELKLDFVEYLVFDEADRLFEMGFADQVNEIVRRCPDARQTMLFSATLPKMIVDFAKAGLTDPCLVRLDVDNKISDKLSMIFLLCRATEKMNTLLYLIREFISRKEQTVVFCATMKHVEYVVAILEHAHISCTHLYSQLDAGARKLNIERFRDRKANILVVTDIAARGVDIPLLDNCINLHFPAKAKLFIHRVGRVARAGKAGRAFSLVAPDEMPYLVDLHLFLGGACKFAKDSDTYDISNHLIGTIPKRIVHLDTDFIKNAHENLEISDVAFKAENAMKKYNVTRPQASAESNRRIKSEMKNVFETTSTHPLLRNRMDDDPGTVNVLKQLGEFRPRATIFEVRCNNSKESVDVMKNKRKMHDEIIKERKKINLKRKIDEAEKAVVEDGFQRQLKAKAETTLTTVDDDGVTVEAAFTDIPLAPGPMAKKKKEEKKVDMYVNAIASDHYAEKQLAVDKSFDSLAKDSQMDITADDTQHMHLQSKKQVWDRKKKKYVSAGGNDDPKNKKVRAEDGHWVKASYKSGIYKDWVSKQKIGFGKQNEEGGMASSGRKFQAQAGSKVGEGAERNELKSTAQIVKSRRTKEKAKAFQEDRRHKNVKGREAHVKKKYTKNFGDEPSQRRGGGGFKSKAKSKETRGMAGAKGSKKNKADMRRGKPDARSKPPPRGGKGKFGNGKTVNVKNKGRK